MIQSDTHRLTRASLELSSLDERRRRTALEAVEIGFDKSPGELAGAVRAEIHEHHDIAVGHRHRR